MNKFIQLACAALLSFSAFAAQTVTTKLDILNLKAQSENVLTSGQPSQTDFVKQAAVTRVDESDIAPEFKGRTLSAEPISLNSRLADLQADEHLSLVFVDSLCPMPQFVGCEASLARLAKRKDNNTLIVVNGHYVDENHVKQFVATNKLSQPVVWDQHNQIFNRNGVLATVTEIRINKNARVIGRSKL